MDRGKQVEQTRGFFDAAAGGWTSRYARDSNFTGRQSRFLNAVQEKLPQFGEILDFGCGSGDIARYISERGYRMTACDVSEAMLAAARQSDRLGRVKWIALADRDPITPLPFAEGMFDAVVASSVFEYLPDIDGTLTELSRVLRPGGWLFASVPDMRDPLRRRERWLRWATNMPGFAALLSHSRWREGAAYLRISANRLSPEAWLNRLRVAGLAPEGLPESDSSLLILGARKV